MQSTPCTLSSYTVSGLADRCSRGFRQASRPCTNLLSADEIYWTLFVNQAAGNVERMEAVDRLNDAAGPVVAAIRHPMAGDTKSADRHWKLTGSPLARFLMMTGRPQTRLGFWFLTIPRISVLEYK
jgi:hypothetical protein